MKVYLVGGAVRDALMNIVPKDRDYVVVGSSPEELMSLGMDQVGKDFPVFLHPETKDEWALARTERKTGNGYGGFTVDTENVTLEDDLFRRDLTINALAMDVDTGDIIDPYGGVKDIDDGVLRHVSDAFSEDPLRVIRLARFKSRYSSFTVAPDTAELAAQVVDSGELNFIPDERFVSEITKVFDDETACITTFFETLLFFGVFQKVKFFTTVFGRTDLRDVWRMGEWAMVVRGALLEQGVHPTVQALAAAFATTVDDDESVKLFGVEVMKTTGAVKAIIAFKAEPDAFGTSVVKLLKRVNSLRGYSSHAALALSVVKLLERRPSYPSTQLDADTLMAFVQITASVDSAPFVERFSGRAIGEEMEKEMALIIENFAKEQS